MTLISISVPLLPNHSMLSTFCYKTRNYVDTSLLGLGVVKGGQDLNQ